MRFIFSWFCFGIIFFIKDEKFSKTVFLFLKIFYLIPNIDCYNNQNIVDLGNILTIAIESSYDLHNRLEIAYKNHIKNKDNKIIVVGSV